MSKWENIGTVVVLLLALVGLETIGMDGMLVVLCWMVMLCLGIGFIGEMLRPPPPPRPPRR